MTAPNRSAPNRSAPNRTRAGRRQHDAESLLAVAVAVFNHRGYDGTTMEHLSAAAGISKSSIYHHVAGKEDILGRALDRALSSLFAVLDGVDPRASPLEQLATVVRRSVQTLIRELPYVTLLLRVRGNSRVERNALQRRREFDAAVAGLVDRAIDDGAVISRLDPALTTRLIFGLVNSVSEWYRPERGMDGVDISEAVVGLVMHGLTAPMSAEDR